MKTPPRETELKFSLPLERAQALATQIPALTGAEPRSLTSVYYDTPKGSLRRAGLSLRVRAQDGAFVQTLKQAGDGALVRGEWESTLPDENPAPDQLDDTPAARALRKAGPLAAQFVIESRRTSGAVREGESRIEISLDEAKAKARGKTADFAELELELKEGPVWGLLTLARRIAQLGDLTLSFTTKADRGYALARPTRDRARKFAGPKLQAQTTAGDAFRMIARACLRQITENAETFGRKSSPEVIHQLRVGLRRLRSMTTTFRAVVTDARLPALKAELEWLTGELDAARNLDVLLQGAYRAALSGRQAAQGLKGLGARLRGARRLAYVRSALALESERCRRLLLDLLIWIEEGPWANDPARAGQRDEPIAKFARRALARRWRKIARRSRDVEKLSPKARHKLRIDAKKLRYAADAFVLLFDHPKRARAFEAALKAVQDKLGQLNDIAVGESLAHEVAAGAGLAASEAAFAAGHIAGARKIESGKLLVEAQDALDALARAKPFWKK